MKRTDAAGGRAWELYQKAKQHGRWDPQEVDLTVDVSQWQEIPADPRQTVMKLCSFFYEGEESVAANLAPYMVAMEGVERQMYLSTQLFEEVKHTEFFRRYLATVMGEVDTLAFFSPELRAVLLDDLAGVATALRRSPDRSDAERMRLLVEAVTHYHGVIEGIIASTAYHGVEQMLAARGMLPGLVQGFRHIRADEGRHITFGMDFLREMAARSPEYQGLIRQTFDRYLPALGPIVEWTLSPNPLQIDVGAMTQYAFEQYQQRLVEIGLQA